MKVYLIDGPTNYMHLLETDLSKQLTSKIREAHFIHIFSTSRKKLETDFEKAITDTKDGLIIWISWYKKSAGLQTDITEDVIRAIVLPSGWVDIKVCAVSDIWSGLKIVKRKAAKA